MAVLRAFLAFDISDEVADRLVDAQRELRETRADVGIVSRELLHFTVKFLGDVTDETAAVVDERMARLELSAFDVTLKGIGVFPDLRRPRIVWAGVASGDEQAVTGRAEAVIEALDGVGKPEEREFRAHVTIGRVRSARNLESLVTFARNNAALEFGRTRISSLKLKSSLLTPKGPIYTDVREYALK